MVLAGEDIKVHRLSGVKVICTHDLHFEILRTDFFLFNFKKLIDTFKYFKM